MNEELLKQKLNVELNAAKETALQIFKNTIVESGAPASLLEKIGNPLIVDFILKSIEGAFETGFTCCMQYVLNEE